MRADQSMTTNSTKRSELMRRMTVWMIVTASVWLITTYIGWVGFGDSDSYAYTKYAFDFNRPPENHWEFRTPAVIAIRASFLVFGVSQLTGCLPALFASVAIIVSTAWLVNWPRKIDWQSQASVLIACTLPLGVALRSGACAPMISAGFLSLGTACVLKGKGWSRYAGAALLGMGFMTHEIGFFYVAIFCFAVLAFDGRRFWRPVLACVAISGSLFLIECGAYQILLGEPLARYKYAGELTSKPIDYHYHFGGSQFLFFVWPLQALVFCKQWGFDLILLLLSGIVVWRRLDTQQKILFVAIFGFWFWLGYGTQVPWAYRPGYREFHYYGCLILPIAVLLPYTLNLAFAVRQWIARGLIVAVILVHLACVAGAGRWGQTIPVSGDLLEYAQEHEDQLFLTDFRTWRLMGVLRGFRPPPENVVSLGELPSQVVSSNSEQLTNTRLTEVFGRPIDGILVNHERSDHATEEHFSRYLERYGGRRTRISPIRYRLLCVPVVPLVGPRDFMVRSLGAEVVQVVDSPLGRRKE